MPAQTPTQIPPQAPRYQEPQAVAAAKTKWQLQGAQTLDLPLGASVQLGRVGGNDLSIPDAGISSRHAILTVSAAALSIRDQGSTNGTWVNGRRLAPETPAPLADGDQLRLGALDFVVRHV